MRNFLHFTTINSFQWDYSENISLKTKCGGKKMMYYTHDYHTYSWNITAIQTNSNTKGSVSSKENVSYREGSAWMQGSISWYYTVLYYLVQ